MSLTLIKSFFSREAEIRRLRKANASLTRLCLDTPEVHGIPGGERIYLVDPKGEWMHTYRLEKLCDASHDNFD